MPRPKLHRRVRGKPESYYFKPAGIPLRELETSTLLLAEFEALRLIDQKELSQEEAAEKMHISQSTLSRVLKNARQKVADALVNGKAIEIEEQKN